MRFLADENVSRFVIERLRADGHEVAPVSEQHSGMPDKSVLETAELEGRILITEDRDFGELVIRQRISVRGVILLELDRLSNLEEGERVSRAVSVYSEKLLDHLTVIEPSRVRMRRLPG